MQPIFNDKNKPTKKITQEILKKNNELVSEPFFEGFIEYFNKTFPQGTTLEKLLNQLNIDKSLYGHIIFRHLRLSGLCVIYHENGVEKMIANYKNGMFHGLCVTIRDNGTMHCSRMFQNNRLHGETKEHDINENIIRITHYKHGEVMQTKSIN